MFFFVDASGGKYMNVVTESFLVHTMEEKCMICVAASEGRKCMIFDADFFLVHTMEGQFMIFAANDGHGICYYVFPCSHNGGEVHDFCC